MPAFIIIGCLLFLSIRIPLLQDRYFDPDELVHLHASWLVSKGQVPYVDFFEHHTPWLYYAIAPFFKLFHVEESAKDTFAFLSFSRSTSLILTTVSLWLLVLAGRKWSNMKGGLFAAFFISCIPLFLRKTLEFRPDVPACAVWIGALYLLFSGINNSEDHKTRAWPLFVGAGLCIGAAIMFTQKMLFVLPGVCSGLLAWCWAGGTNGRKPRTFCSAALLAGVVAPCVVTWLAFVLSGHGYDFIEKNFLLNAAWKTRSSPIPRLAGVFNESWPVVLFASGGLLICYWKYREFKSTDWIGVVLLTTLAGLLAGLWIIPMAQDQYFLILTPILALLAARGMSQVSHDLPSKIRGPATCMSLLALCILPVLHARAQFQLTNRQQLQDVRFVMDRTSPGDMVMDGFRGLGLFRPHAFYYFFLHAEIRAMLPQQELERFLSELEAGRIAPKIIAMDDNLGQLSERFGRHVQEHYEFITGPNIYIARTGEQPPYMLPTK